MILPLINHYKGERGIGIVDEKKKYYKIFDFCNGFGAVSNNGYW